MHPFPVKKPSPLSDIGVLLLLFDSVALLGCVVVSGGGDVEVFEGLLEEGGGVFVCAATLHVCGDVGPEGGGVGVFDFLLGGEEVLVL